MWKATDETTQFLAICILKQEYGQKLTESEISRLNTIINGYDPDVEEDETYQANMYGALYTFKKGKGE